MNGSARRGTAFAVSAVLHALFLSRIALPSRVAGPSPQPLQVELYEPPPAPAAAAPVAPKIALPPPPRPAAPEPPPAAVPLPETQIVSPPEGGEASDPGRTRLLSDRDVRVAEQSVRRGEGGSGAAEGRPAAHAAPVRAARQPASSAPRLEQLAGLLPLAAELARAGYGREPTPVPSPRGRDILRYSGPPPGRRGTMDFLPDVREGDITLLNTKAARFAPFVRRVATRVFQLQVISLRREVRRFRRTGEEEVAIEAIMSPEGTLHSLVLRERSAPLGLDLERHLRAGCEEGFFDRNPPPGTGQADGKIHFLFRTHVRLYAAPDGRLVGHALFQAGLL